MSFNQFFFNVLGNLPEGLTSFTRVIVGGCHKHANILSIYSQQHMQNSCYAYSNFIYLYIYTSNHKILPKYFLTRRSMHQRMP